MISLHIFTEEESAKRLFDILISRLFPELNFRVYPHQGKQDLKEALTKTLPVISKKPGSRILVTIDQDSGDCILIKNSILTMVSTHCQCPVKIRIICRELESWFLGDLDSIKKVYPRFNPIFYKNKRTYRNVDLIHNPDKHLLKAIPELKNKNYFPKVEFAEKLAPLMNYDNNTSISFKNTLKGINSLLES